MCCGLIPKNNMKLLQGARRYWTASQPISICSLVLLDFNPKSCATPNTARKISGAFVAPGQRFVFATLDGLRQTGKLGYKAASCRG